MFRRSLWAYGVVCLQASAKYLVGFVALEINRKDHFSVEWSAVFPNISVAHKDKTLPKQSTKSLPRTKRLIQDWLLDERATKLEYQFWWRRTSIWKSRLWCWVANAFNIDLIVFPRDFPRRMSLVSWALLCLLYFRFYFTLLRVFWLNYFNFSN